MNFNSRFIGAQYKKLLLSKRSRLSAAPEADCFQTKSFATEPGLAWPGLARLLRLRSQPPFKIFSSKLESKCVKILQWNEIWEKIIA